MSIAVSPRKRVDIWLSRALCRRERKTRRMTRKYERSLTASSSGKPSSRQKPLTSSRTCRRGYGAERRAGEEGEGWGSGREVRGVGRRRRAAEDVGKTRDGVLGPTCRCSMLGEGEGEGSGLGLDPPADALCSVRVRVRVQG